MPEEIEVDTDELREKVHEELEREGGNFLKVVALSTAMLAALAAVGSLEAGGTVNEALVLKTEATRLQAQASDQWAYYQAKGIKLELQHAAGAAWRAAHQTPPPELDAQVARYTREQGEIQQRAQELERERDARSREADGLLHRHHRFADAVALFQVAIALGAVAALTRLRPVWVASVLLGLGGLMTFVIGFRS
jgi:hypothetical protein